MHSFRTTVATSVEQVEKLRPLWDKLLRQQPRTVFQRFHWNHLALEVFSDRLSPYVCAVESPRGAAIIPAAVNRQCHRVELIGEALFDYRDVLHAGDADLLAAAWQMAAELNLPLSVTAVDSSAVSCWAEFHPAEFARAPWVDSARIRAEEFRLLHTRAARQLRRLQRQGIALHEYSGADQELVRRIYQLKSDQFAGDPNNIFHDQRRRDFMMAIAALEGAACKVFTLEDAAGCIVAGLVTFLDGHMRHFYTIYFDPQWAHYSPGVALVFEATARSLEHGLSCDYMTGEYPYKLRFANAARTLYRIDVSAAELAAIVRVQPQLMAS